jgi:hypothetical protein
MLLKKKCLDYKAKITVGMGLLSLGGLCLAVSLLLKRFGGPGNGIDFFEGFFLGLSIVTMGASIYFNSRGLRERRLQEGSDG